METKEAIAKECGKLQSLLLAKNKEYGDSALNPTKIFSQLGVIDRIKVRIDDKLARVAEKSAKTIKEDTVLDLLGYLIFLRIVEEQEKEPAEEQQPHVRGCRAI